MTTTGAATADVRRLLLLAPDRRLDIVVPVGGFLGGTLAELGYRIEGTAFSVLDQYGRPLGLETPVEKLRDGAVLAIVDPEAPDAVDLRRRPRAQGQAPLVAGAFVFPVALLGALLAAVLWTAGADAPDGPLATARPLIAAVLAGAALSAALLWARGSTEPRLLDLVTAIPPLTLAAATGVAIVDPAAAGADRLVAVVASGTVAATLALMLMSSRSARLRGALGVLVAIALVHGIVWLLALLLGAPAAAAAAVCLGAVPLALRGLPAALLDVPPGFHIDFDRFMTNRPTVRGEVPPSPSRIDGDYVTELIGVSSARLVAGTVALSALAAVSAPLAAGVLTDAGVLERVGAIALAITVLISLLTVPRGFGHPVARWAPRTAAVVVGAVVSAALVGASSLLTWFIIGAALVIAVGLAFLLAPLAAGLRSLAASRTTDIVETMSVVLALPAGLVAAGTIEIVRGLMS